MQHTGHFLLRIMLFLGIFLSAYIAPSWLTFSVALIPIVYFKNYWEFFIIIFLLDFLYAPTVGSSVVGSTALYTCIGALTYGGIQILKRRLFIFQS